MVLLTLSTNQHAPALANGRYTLPETQVPNTPTQKPRHKLHLNRSAMILTLQINLLGILRIVPYLSIQCNPIQDIISIIFYSVKLPELEE